MLAYSDYNTDITRCDKKKQDGMTLIHQFCKEKSVSRTGFEVCLTYELLFSV